LEIAALTDGVKWSRKRYLRWNLTEMGDWPVSVKAWRS